MRFERLRRRGSNEHPWGRVVPPWIGGHLLDMVTTRFGKDAFWSTVGNFVTQGFSFCSTVIVARLLTKQEFGQYAIFLSSVALLSIMSGLGLGVAISTLTAELRTTDPGLLGRKLTAAYLTGGGGAGVLTALMLLAWIFTSGAVAGVSLEPVFLGLLILALAVYTASALQAAELIGYQSFRSLAAAQCIRGVALVPLCTAGAFALGLPGVISGLVIATTLSVLMQSAALKKERCDHHIALARPSRAELRAVLACSLPAFGATVAQATGFWGGNVTVASMGAGGVAAVAEYGAAGQVNNMILFLPNIIGQVLMPTVANRKATHPNQIWSLVRFSIALNTAVALLLAAGFIALREPIASLFGARYVAASAAVALIGVGAVLYVAQNTLSLALIGYGHISPVTLANILAAVAFTGAAGTLYSLAPQLGSQCLGFAYILSSTVQLLVNLACLLRLRAAGAIRLPAGICVQSLEGGERA